MEEPKTEQSEPSAEQARIKELEDAVRIQREMLDAIVAKDDEDDDDYSQVFTSEYEVKAHLANPSILHQLKASEDLINKDLALSNIDTEYAYILKSYLNVAANFYHLGYPDIAKYILEDVQRTMLVIRSVGGRDRIINALNSASAATQIDLADFGGRFRGIEEQGDNSGFGGIGDKLKGGLSSIRNRKRD